MPFVWQDAMRRFEEGRVPEHDPNNLANYDIRFQYRDPITFKLQARCEVTLVAQVMPRRELMRTEFFNDFLAHDGGIKADGFEACRAPLGPE